MRRGPGFVCAAMLLVGGCAGSASGRASVTVTARSTPIEASLVRLTDARRAEAVELADALTDDELAWSIRYVEQRLAEPAPGAALLDPARISADVAAAFPERPWVEATTGLLLVGHVSGAVAVQARSADAGAARLSRALVAKLDAVHAARAKVIASFARRKPPRAYAGTNPSTAARAQDRSTRYARFVQFSAQLLNELQSTERELLDALQSQFRDQETFWQTVATFRDETFRTNDRVMTTR